MQVSAAKRGAPEMALIARGKDKRGEDNTMHDFEEVSKARYIGYNPTSG